MQTEAIFENIAEHIQQEIAKSESSIYIAVAWFTNKNLFDVLLYKATKGCRVHLIISNDFINKNSTIDYELLNKGNSKVYKIGNGDSVLMHNKFCVVDYNTVITGSYNWSYKAENNFENVIITKDDTKLAEQFIQEFNNIRNQYYPKEKQINSEFPLAKIIKRLEIVKNYVLLEDVDELVKESNKLKEFIFNQDIQEITNAINNHKYALVISKIEVFITKYNQLSVWVDPEIEAMKLEIKILENKVNAFDNEKIELEKTLSYFQHRHNIELGGIIVEILRLRKIKFKNYKEKFEEAVEDENQYSEQLKEEKEKQYFELTDEEKVELKNRFRKASMLSHPDKVSEEFKLVAEKIFIDLKQAYDANDLQKVNEILADLEKGNYFKTKSQTIAEKDLLKAAIAKLIIRIQSLETEIITIKESDTFKTIHSITDWDNYFKTMKEKLQVELYNLNSETTNP